MSSEVLERIQTALLEQALLTEVKDPEPELFSPILTDYLDTLLRSATEIPESRLEQFKCLHFTSAGQRFLTPLTRIARIDYAKDNQRRFAFQIPEHMSSGQYMMRIGDSRSWLFFDTLEGLETVQSIDVIWRANAPRSPWFVGTHKSMLCRIFDPEILMEGQ
ncbi:MAG: hypothetical protein ACE37D_16530 [Pseudomonadales bacterium]|jgi:hypothetical protein